MNRSDELVEIDIGSMISSGFNLDLTSTISIQTNKINLLYEILLRWDSFYSLLPLILNRLITLKSLHEQSNLSINRIKEISLEQEEIKKKLSESTSMLKN